MERNYTTQMDAARRGIVTQELETVARKERMSTEEMCIRDSFGRSRCDRTVCTSQGDGLVTCEKIEKSSSAMKVKIF